MSRLTLSLLKPFFIVGIPLPYLHLAFSTSYLAYVYLMLKEAFALSAPSFLGLLSLILWAGKPLLGSRGWYWDAVKIVVISIITLPALLFITSLLFIKDLFNVSINMYLAGIAVILIIAPWFILFSQVESVVKVKESVVFPAIGTFVAYVVIDMLVAAGASKAVAVVDLSTLGSSLLQQIGATILAMASFVGDTGVLPNPTGRMNLSSDEIWLGAIFALTSALYFYYRLYNPKDDQPDPTRPGKVFPISFAIVGLTVLGAVSLNLAILLLGNAFALSLWPFLNLSLVGALIIVLITIPRG